MSLIHQQIPALTEAIAIARIHVRICCLFKEQQDIPIVIPVGKEREIRIFPMSRRVPPPVPGSLYLGPTQLDDHPLLSL
jgi:hypothetical protein